jgi:hypothetical protein
MNIYVMVALMHVNATQSGLVNGSVISARLPRQPAALSREWRLAIFEVVMFRDAAADFNVCANSPAAFQLVTFTR